MIDMSIRCNICGRVIEENYTMTSVTSAVGAATDTTFVSGTALALRCRHCSTYTNYNPVTATSTVTIRINPSVADSNLKPIIKEVVKTGRNRKKSFSEELTMKWQHRQHRR